VQQPPGESDRNTQSDFGTKTHSAPDLDTKTQSQRDLDTKTQSLRDLDTKTQSLRDLDTKTQSLRDLDTKTQSLRDLDTKTQSLRDLLGSRAEEEPLPPERAFAMQAQAVGADAVAVTFTPAPTYYLYRSKFAFSVAQPAGVSVQEVKLPKGEMKDDPIFGHTEVYHEGVQALVSLRSAGALPGEVDLDVTMQGCTERGLCYPPDTRRTKVLLAAAAPATTAIDVPTAVESVGAEADESKPARDFSALQWALLGLVIAGVGTRIFLRVLRRR
jgi:thiol:disulfide interchange protein